MYLPNETFSGAELNFYDRDSGEVKKWSFKPGIVLSIAAAFHKLRNQSQMANAPISCFCCTGRMEERRQARRRIKLRALKNAGSFQQIYRMASRPSKNSRKTGEALVPTDKVPVGVLF